MLLYKSVLKYGEAEKTIEKSRFIAHVRPVDSYDGARSFVSEIKEKYRDATHNVPAIICGDKQEMCWASDDGEPQGTSGGPMLKVATDAGLTYLALVVTRYFGGIKLGTGGLVRAYTDLAKAGIEAAGICEVRDSVKIFYRVDYRFSDKIKNAVKTLPYTMGDAVYTDKIEIPLACETENEAAMRRFMEDMTSGTAEISAEEKSLIRIPI